MALGNHWGRWFCGTVDGWNPANQLIGSCSLHFSRVLAPFQVVSWISEPSTVSFCFFKRLLLGSFWQNPSGCFFGELLAKNLTEKTARQKSLFFSGQMPGLPPLNFKNTPWEFLKGFPGWDPHPQRQVSYTLDVFSVCDFPLFMFLARDIHHHLRHEHNFYFGFFTRPIYISWTHRNAPSTLGFIDLENCGEFAISKSWYLPYGFSRSVLFASCGCIFSQPPTFLRYGNMCFLPPRQNATLCLWGSIFTSNKRWWNMVPEHKKNKHLGSINQVCFLSNVLRHIRPTKSWHPQKKVQLPPKKNCYRKNKERHISRQMIESIPLVGHPKW